MFRHTGLKEFFQTGRSTWVGHDPVKRYRTVFDGTALWLAMRQACDLGHATQRLPALIEQIPRRP